MWQHTAAIWIRLGGFNTWRITIVRGAAQLPLALTLRACRSPTHRRPPPADGGAGFRPFLSCRWFGPAVLTATRRLTDSAVPRSPAESRLEILPCLEPGCDRDFTPKSVQFHGLGSRRVCSTDPSLKDDCLEGEGDAARRRVGGGG